MEKEIECYVQEIESLIEKARNEGRDLDADRLRHRLLRASAVNIPKQPDFADEIRGDAPVKNG